MEVSNQDKNSEMFLDSTKPDSSTPSSHLEQSINDQNVHPFSSNMENIKDEKSQDLFPGPTSTGDTDLILPNQPPTHCEVVHERALQTVEESTQPLTEAETGEENEHLEKSLECVGDNSKDHTVQHIKDKDFQILGNADSKYFVSLHAQGTDTSKYTTKYT